MSFAVSVKLPGQGKKFEVGNRVRLGNAKCIGNITGITPDPKGATLIIEVDAIDKLPGGFDVKKV